MKNWIIISLTLFIMLTALWFARLETKKPQNSSAVSIHQVKQSQLVDNFPDFPEYPGSQLVWSKKEGVVNDYEASWEIKGPTPSEIMDWYLNVFQQEGWDVIEPPPIKPVGEMFTVVGRGDKLYYLTIEKYPDEVNTEIQVEVIPKSLRKDN